MPTILLHSCLCHRTSVLLQPCYDLVVCMQDELYLQQLADACLEAVRRLLGPRKALLWIRSLPEACKRQSACLISTSCPRLSKSWQPLITGRRPYKPETQALSPERTSRSATQGCKQIYQSSLDLFKIGLRQQQHGTRTGVAAPHTSYCCTGRSRWAVSCCTMA